MSVTRKPEHARSWVTLPLNVVGGMPLGHRSFGYHDTDGQSQRVIGRHVYIMQRSRSGLTAWRSEMADESGGYRWTLAHSWPPAGTGGPAMTLRRAAALNALAGAVSLLLLALGRHIQTGGHRA